MANFKIKELKIYPSEFFEEDSCHLEKSKEFYSHIGRFAMSHDLVKEYNGYPLLNKPGWNWVLAFNEINECVGFLTYTLFSIENVYVRHDYRNNGVMSILYNKFVQSINKKHIKINLIATAASKPIFEKYGFKITKPYKNWWKMEKEFIF